jgi:hypothetical protein
MQFADNSLTCLNDGSCLLGERLSKLKEICSEGAGDYLDINVFVHKGSYPSIYSDYYAFAAMDK